MMTSSCLKVFFILSLEEAQDGDWGIDEVTKKFQRSAEGNYWKVAFKEGVDLDEKLLQGNSCKKTPEEFIARYDLTYLTPCFHQIRCKVKNDYVVCIAVDA